MLPEDKIAEFIDQSRWLLNNGLVNHATKNNLFLYGSIVHRDVKGVEVELHVSSKIVQYDIYLPAKVINAIKTYEKLSESNTLWSLWRRKRILKRYGNVDLKKILTKFVKDYCGDAWMVQMRLLDFALYTDEYSEKRINKDVGTDFVSDTKSN